MAADFKKRSVNLLLAIVLLGLFYPAFHLAKQTANKEAQRKRMGHAKNVILVFKKDVTKFYPAEFLEANKKGEFKLLTQTEDRYYVFYQRLGGEKVTPNGISYDIPRADILMAMIKMQGFRAQEEL